MQEVWIAKTESWDGSMILGVYSTQSLAEAAVEKHMAKCDSPPPQFTKTWNSVIKFDLDQDAGSYAYIVDTTMGQSIICQQPVVKK